MKIFFDTSGGEDRRMKRVGVFATIAHFTFTMTIVMSSCCGYSPENFLIS
jgi:hypothetical protein